mgnify:CR=1 FL=1
MPRTWPVVLAGATPFLDLYATQPIMPLMMREFSTTRAMAGLTLSAATLAVALAAPFVGRVADRVGRKRVIVVSAVLLAAMTAGSATARSLWALIGWRFAQGIVTPGLFATTIAYIQEEWPPSHVGRASAAYVSGTVSGGFVGRTLVALVADRQGWPAAFWVLAALTACVASVLARWLPEERRAPRARAVVKLRGVLQLLRFRPLMATNAVGFSVLFTLMGTFSYITFHLSAPPYALSTAALGWLFVVYLVGAAATPVAGQWVDRHGHRRGMALATSTSIVGAVLTLGGPLWVVFVGLALVGTGAFIAQATTSSFIGVVTREDRGLAVGIYSSVYYIGGSVAGVVPALFWEAGGWALCVALVVAVQIASGVIVYRWWHPPTVHA